MDYFKKLQDLLKVELNEDRSQYLKLTESSSAAERRTNGITWYPVAIRGTEPSRGDYLTVELERTTHQDIGHQFRFGSSAAIFSNHDPKNDRLEGTVSYQGGNRLKLTLFTDELPDWCRNDKLGVDLLFDNNSYNEMQNALKQATSMQDTRLVQILTSDKLPSFSTEAIHLSLPGLNASQQNAVKQIVSAQDVAIIHGPPGTGKTTTLVQAIKALISNGENKVLVVAPSNTAVDLLSEKLAAEGLNVLRIGNPARVSDRLMALTLDSKMTDHSQTKEIKRLKKMASEFKNMAHKYKRSFGKAERDQRKALFDEAHKIMKDVDKTEQYIIDDVVAKAQVISATLVGSNHYTIRNLKFNTVVIDEAGQALEPACWIPILKAQKLVLAGDHCQLSPTIKSAEAARNGLSTTLLEKCINLHPEAVTLLDVQYRMNEAIMDYSAKVFYYDKLQADASVAHHVLFNGDQPFTFVDTAGCGFNEKPVGTSVANPEEAAFLFKHLSKLVAEIGGMFTANTFPSVAIISPYQEQIRLLREQLENTPELQQYSHKIAVNTIDSFQGQERDIVYIGMARSNSDGEIGFLADIRRMNVAMTRARKKLVIIGDSSTLAVLPFYADLVSYAERVNGYQSAWDLMEY
ncbi:MAG: AAA domain-containing protein [Mucilaginibacter sp.]|uniref:AAA domain-containing protein n=1 Tax=Mucilaginibacter sp. TaxID=1882438 RepID=UPI00326311DC